MSSTDLFAPLKFFLKLLSLIINEFRSLLQCAIMSLPNSYIGNYLRRHYWSNKFNIKDANFFGRGAEINSIDILKVGKRLILGPNVVIDNGSSFGCYIGNYVAIARGSYIRTGNHNFSDTSIPIMNQGHSAAIINFRGGQYSVVIEDDVWIGANVMILSGAHIAHGSIVAAGTVVSRAFPPYSIIAGNPAYVISSRC